PILTGIPVVSILAITSLRPSWDGGSVSPREANMPRTSSARPSGVLFGMAAATLLGFGSATLAWAQPPAQSPQPPRAAQLGSPTSAVEPPTASQVFPEGGSPATPPAPEGGIPAPSARPAAGALPTPPAPPSADYAPPGYEPRGIQQPPGVPEFFRPIAAPLP